MAGRRRRASTSSVDTIDESEVFWRQEISVLKSVLKEPNNDWPVFELRDAVVLNKDGQTMESALDVRTKGPFIVRGTLIIDDDAQKTQLLMRVRKSMPIEIRQSTEYSIGMDQDDNPIIWASGRGGWYEINPSPAYQETYNKSCQACVMYYRILDIHKSQPPRKSKKGKGGLTSDLDRIFHQYAAIVGDGSTIEEVYERCAEYAPFLVSQAIVDTESGEFDWSVTYFNKWLITKYPDIYEKAKKPPTQPPRSPSVELLVPDSRVLPSRTRTGSSISSVSYKASTPDAGEPSGTMSRSRSARSRSITSITDTVAPVANPQALPSQVITPISAPLPALPPSMPAPGISEPGSPAAGGNADITPFQSVLIAVKDILNDSGPKSTASSIISKLYFRYRIPTYNPPGVTASYRVPVQEILHYNAVALLEALRDNYSHCDLYSWLQLKAHEQFAPIAIPLSKFPFYLPPRAKKPVAEPVRPSTLISAAARTDMTHDPSSTTSTPPVGKRPRGRPAGKKSALRLATTSQKRPHHMVDSDSEMEQPPAQRSHFFSDDAVDSVGRATSPEAESEHDSAGEPVKFVIRAEKIPSTVPRGPDGTWTCDEEDCDFMVRAGDAEEYERRIQQHFKHHGRESQRVNLAMTESRGLPINHLIEKLKKLGEKSQRKEQITVDGVTLPQPIKRKLLI